MQFRVLGRFTRFYDPGVALPAQLVFLIFHMSEFQRSRAPKNEDNPQNENEPKMKMTHKNEDYPKNEDDLKIEYGKQLNRT